MHARLSLSLLCLSSCSVCAAMDGDLRVVPEVLVGTAGFEPGVAAEYRPLGGPAVAVRPELFINEDGRVGGGGAILCDVSSIGGLPANQRLDIGPRVVHHNADDNGMELDAMATWGYDFGGVKPWRHSVEAIGAAGVRDDRDDDALRFGLSLGVAYAFRF